MSNVSPVLGLPYLEAAQAQKHVTHNEALERLDVLAQLSVEGFDVISVPISPDEGEIYAIGNGATAEWAGQDGRLAAWIGGAWSFIEPKPGWRAWGRAEAELRIWSGTSWVAPSGDLNNLDGVGIGASWDATNRLVVASDASLLTHTGASHQLKLNKASSSDTASLLYQSNWSGRAEMGLNGTDDFGIKVSDGSSWFEAIGIDQASGRVTFPSGLNGTGTAAGPMGGQTVAITGERNGNLGANTYMALGNGASTTAGATMPFSGRVLAISVSTQNGTAGTNVLRLTVNKVETSADVILNYSGSGVETAFTDLSAAPVPFAAGDALNMKSITVSPINGTVTTIFAQFD